MAMESGLVQYVFEHLAFGCGSLVLHIICNENVLDEVGKHWNCMNLVMSFSFFQT